jgi:hypothetical protein
MKPGNHSRLDFDYLIGLAQSSPSEFERLRLNAIESYIVALPPERQQRLRRLQWRIDQERRNHCPMGACVRLSRMMWEHLLSPGGLVGMLQGDWSDRDANCEVIPFPASDNS